MSNATTANLKSAPFGDRDEAFLYLNPEAGQGEIWIIVGDSLKRVVLNSRLAPGSQQASLVGTFGRALKFLKLDLPSPLETRVT
ncbi:MAG TPA: hypothetical protein VGQ19_08865 [Burkholderiales bacterium]|nr:hypothetical protein [Burkholderiales bacterium]